VRHRDRDRHRQQQLGIFACFRGAPFDTLDLSVSIAASASLVTLTTNFTYSITVTTKADQRHQRDRHRRFARQMWASFPHAFAGNRTTNGGIVTCELGSLAHNGTATILVTVIATASGSLSNYVSVLSAEPENLPSNNSAVTFPRPLAWRTWP